MTELSVGGLPSLGTTLNDCISAARGGDVECKEHMLSATEHCKPEEQITQGDAVLVLQQCLHKLDTPYRPDPLVVMKTKGTRITATDGHLQVTRDVPHFRLPRETAPVIRDPGNEPEAEPSMRDL